jgi:hypothetical protein
MKSSGGVLQETLEVSLWWPTVARTFKSLWIPLGCANSSKRKGSLCPITFIAFKYLRLMLMFLLMSTHSLRFMGTTRTKNRHRFTGLSFSFLYISFILTSFFLLVLFSSLPLFIFRLLFYSFFSSFLHFSFLISFCVCQFLTATRCNAPLEYWGHVFEH